MANTLYSFDSEHQGIVHDAQYDYYGRRIATAGSDGKINIFEIVNDATKKVAELNKHEHSVWQVSWSHPRFGNLIASCGFDKKVLIWKETSPNYWEKIYEYAEHKNSVNSLAWAPQEYGLILLCGSSDGFISLHEYKNEQWISNKELAHNNGVNSVSWGPAFMPITFQKEDDESLSYNILAPMRFVTGGSDNLVKVWTATKHESDLNRMQVDFNEQGMKSFFKSAELEGHTEWVRDVSWLNYVGYAYDTIASCGEDGTVRIWKCYEGNWKNYKFDKEFGVPTWKVSWSHCGTYLAVSAGDNCVYLFKENVDGKWEETSKVNQDGQIDSNQSNEQN